MMSGVMKMNNIVQRHEVFLLHKKKPRKKVSRIFAGGDIDAFLKEEDYKPEILTNEKNIKKYYGDTSVEVESWIFERSLKVEDNKLILKTNTFIKGRRIGKKYFRKRFFSRISKIDLIKGNFLTVESSGTSKKRRGGVFRVNSFNKLSDNINHFVGYVDTVGRHIGLQGYSNNVTLNKVFDTKEILSHSPINVSMNSLMRFFVDKKSIKTPDGDYRRLLKDYYPTEKYLKKNNRKLVQSITDMLGVRSKYSTKLFHMNIERMDIHYYVYMYRILGGVPNISNINPEVFLSTSHVKDVSNKFHIIYHTQTPVISDNEKQCLIKIVNDSMGVCLTREFDDHFRMLRKLRRYFPDMELTTTKRSTFLEEHSRLGTLMSQIKKGYEVVFEYDEEMLMDLQLPINIGDDSFTPYVLMSETDYKEEGDTMKHCVYSYHDRSNSFIVSLRSTESNNDRVTCEFSVETGKMVQDKYLMNGRTPDNFLPAVEELKNRVKKWHQKDKISQLNRVEKPLKVNGMDVDPEDIVYNLTFEDLPF